MTRRTRRRALALLAAALAAGAALLAWVSSGLPARGEVRALAKQAPGRTRLMLQREEEAGARGRRVPRAAPVFVPLASVSRHLIHAVLASEDQKFFGHEGVDWKAIQESLEKNVERRRFARGGSTISQQLAKNLFFGTAKTPVRKLRELVVTRWLEEDLTKARILALYLNVIEWGDFVYGCEAAARHWYGKPASQLVEAEAAGLAAMIPNPRRINPRVSPERHERATRRVLWLMARAGYIARDVAPLGAEPPPELLTDEEEEPADAVSESSPTPPPASPLSPSPSPSPSPVASPSPPPTPHPQ
jgi:monofunctional biosynthetic peptidoglycan transglycosylase